MRPQPQVSGYVIHPDIPYSAAGGGGHDGDLTLLYQFDKNLSLAAIDGLGPTLGITRTTDATYFDSAGVMQTASSGVARFDHLPISPFTSLGLLVEEARTNICLQSEDFSTTWGGTRLTVTTNQTAAPDGATTADKIADAGGGSTAAAFQSITFATATVFTISVFAKKDVADWIKLTADNLAVLDVGAFFDLTNGVVGATTGTDNTSEFIQDVGDGWFRCGITFTSDAADSTGILQVFIADADNDTTVDTGDSVFVWGAQAEVGAFPTSYIPTVAASVTRNADNVDTTDVSWYVEAAGTFYGLCSVPDADQPAAGGIPFIACSGSAVNRFHLRKSAAGNTQYLVTSSNVTQADMTLAGSNYTDGVNANLAIAYDTNDFVLYKDGTSATPDTSGTVPTGITTLRIGRNAAGSASWWNGHIAEIRYYNVRKANAFLADLSNGLLPE